MAALANTPPVVPRRMAFLQLMRATNSFSNEAKIGEGATGEVFRANLDGVPVAVKRLKLPEGATNFAREELERRFRAEFDTLSTYQHARIVKLLGWGGDGDPNSLHPFCLVFELLEGGSLADRLLSPSGEQPAIGPLSDLARIDIALGVGAGLSFLHGLREPGDDANAPLQAALHRDVKSANIGLGPEPAGGGSPYAKVLDCGLTKAVGGGGGAAAAAAAAGVSFTGGLVAGTAGYMAPEVANGKYTVQSEVYSFGVVLLELFSGRRVGPETATEARECAEDDGIESVAALGEDGVWPLPAAQTLAALIVDCLQVREKKRPPAVATVVARLKEVRALVDVAVVAPLVGCCVCLEDVAEGLAVRCLGVQQRHSLCRGCLQDYVVMNLEPRRLAAIRGGIPCPSCAGEAPCWVVEDHLQTHLEVGTLAKYAAALRYQLFDAQENRQRVQDALAAQERAAQAANLALADKAQRHRSLIVERHLYLRCPRCAAKFDDYDGCNALSCGLCGCGFCAVCLADCGADAHHHIRAAHGHQDGAGRDAMFNKPLFEEERTKRFLGLVVGAVAELAGQGPELQRLVVAELAKADLRDLGITAEQVLEGAAVGRVGLCGGGGAVYGGGGGGRGGGAVYGGGGGGRQPQNNKELGAQLLAEFTSKRRQGADLFAEVRKLIDAGADPNVADRIHGFTPLIYAAYYGRADCVAALVGAGAKLEATGRGGNTPLIAAARMGRADCVAALVGAGAKLEATDSGGDTARDLAVRYKQNQWEEVVKLLDAHAGGRAPGNY